MSQYTALCAAAGGGGDTGAGARNKFLSAYAYIVPPMGCFIALLALFSPRLALVAIWLFSDLLSRAFDSWFLPLLGFFLLPWTTLAYAVMWSTGTNEVSGFEWFIVVLAFLLDLGSYANGRRSRAAYA
jgi:hypothetical protein